MATGAANKAILRSASDIRIYAGSEYTQSVCNCVGDMTVNATAAATAAPTAAPATAAAPASAAPAAADAAVAAAAEGMRALSFWGSWWQ